MSSVPYTLSLEELSKKPCSSNWLYHKLFFSLWVKRNEHDEERDKKAVVDQEKANIHEHFGPSFHLFLIDQ